MRHLLDVNALLALLVAEHSLHVRTLAWVQDVIRKDREHALLTCSITELGFLRIVSHAYGRTVMEGRALLSRAKAGSTVKFVFIADDQPASELPAWVLRPQQVTDGHLVALAKSHTAVLATLDEKIPGAFVVPR